MVDSASSALALAPRFRAYVGMGGNLGDVLDYLNSALACMANLPGTAVEAVSGIYRTKPVDATGPDYLNAVAALQTALGPLELLHALQLLEIQHDRTRPYRHAPRTLDLDLLWFDGLRHDTPELMLPHPRMTARAFVLVPLADVLKELEQGADPTLRATLPSSANQDKLAREQGVISAGVSFGKLEYCKKAV